LGEDEAWLESTKETTGRERGQETMTTHDKIATVVKPYAGKVLTAKEVQALVLEKYPETNPTSIIPSDHSGPNPRSGRSYCRCSQTPLQIFTHESGNYRVLDPARVMAVDEAVRIPGTKKQQTRPQRARSAVVIDDAFLREWEPKYDRVENDEGEYQEIVAVVARNMGSTGTISKETFLRIWSWKGVMRVLHHVRLEEYDTRYSPTFRRAALAPPERKLAILLGPGVKLPGLEAATGSTVLHFMHPQMMPIIDVRTVEVLFSAGLISTERKDLEHYEEFRRAIEGIRRACPAWNLRQIDRALFAYHKLYLDKASKTMQANPESCRR
jgi:hypothetical protein